MTARWIPSDRLATLDTPPDTARVRAADLVLVASVLVLLCGSYIYCLCSRKWRGIKRRQRRAADREIFVKDMAEPLLGPLDYAQPPAFEPRPPAYDYLPSAPPMSP